MYHALMEEVVRFLERCYQSIESIQKNNKIARSRSINHMFIEQSAQSSTKNERRISDIGSLRSNLNIAADKTGVNYAQSEKDQLNESFASSITTTSNSTDSYNNFTDFTWQVAFFVTFFLSSSLKCKIFHILSLYYGHSIKFIVLFI